MKRTVRSIAVAQVPILTNGGTIVCIATGRSLTPEDVEYCRGKAPVIAISDAWKLAPWADVLYCSDQHWWSLYRYVPEFRGIRIAIQPTGHPSVLTLKSTGKTGIEWQRNALRTGQNSGAAAINLAVHLGATRIVLLGYDMGGDHFFGKHPKGLRNASADDFQRFRRMTETMAAPLQARGIQVVNSSRQTALSCFERISLREALPEQMTENVA